MCHKESIFDFNTSLGLLFINICSPGNLNQCKDLEFGVIKEREKRKALRRGEMYALGCIFDLCMQAIGFCCPALGIVT